MQNHLQGKKTSPQEKMGLRANLQMKQKPVLKNQNLANVLTLKGSNLKKTWFRNINIMEIFSRGSSATVSQQMWRKENEEKCRKLELFLIFVEIPGFFLPGLI